MNIILVFFNYFVWASSFSLAKEAMKYAPPICLTGVRMTIAGLLLLGFIALYRRESFKVKKEQILPLLFLAVFSVYLTNIFEFWGLQYLTAAKACFIYSLSPFFAALFSYLQFKEKITSRKFLGLMVGFIGFSPIFLEGLGEKKLGGSFFIFSLPELALILATLTSVYGWILLRKLGKDEGMSPLMANGASMLLGGIFALTHSFFVDSWTPTPITAMPSFLKWVFLIIAISNLFCYNLYGFLLKRATATFLSFAGLTTPLFAAIWGFLMHGESIPWVFYLSMGLVGMGLWLVYSEELKLGYLTPGRKTRSSKATI